MAKKKETEQATEEPIIYRLKSGSPVAMIAKIAALKNSGTISDEAVTALMPEVLEYMLAQDAKICDLEKQLLKIKRAIWELTASK